LANKALDECKYFIQLIINPPPGGNEDVSALRCALGQSTAINQRSIYLHREMRQRLNEDATLSSWRKKTISWNSNGAQRTDVTTVERDYKVAAKLRGSVLYHKLQLAFAFVLNALEHKGRWKTLQHFANGSLLDA
jgi:hypothetical protein